MIAGRAFRASLRPLVLGAILALSLAACGNEAPPTATGALQVELVLPAVEGTLPEAGFTLKEAGGAVVPLRPVSKGERGPIYEAQGPAGSWTLATPEGLRPIGGHTMDMTPGMPAIALGVGRARTIYLQPPDRGSIADVTVLVVTPTDPRGRVAEIERLGPGPDHRMGLRLPESILGAALRIHAVLAGGTHATPLPARASQDGTPLFFHLEPTRSSPFVVRWIDLPPAKTAVGEPIQLVSTLGTLDSTETARLEGDAAARFAQMPGEPEALRVRGPSVDLDVLDAGLGLGEAAVLSVSAEAAGRAHLRVRGFTASGGALVVQVRPEGASSYGLLPCEPLPGAGTEVACALRLPPGRYRVSARQGERLAISAVPFEVSAGAGGEPVAVELDAVRPATLAVALEGGAPAGRRFEVEARRVEDGVEVLGQGFCARNLARPDLALSLPPGVYRVRALEGSRLGPVKELTLDVPGVRAQVRLALPR